MSAATAATSLVGISSMATRQVLGALGSAIAERDAGLAARIESVGGVDAAKRVEAGEAFDLVFLASDAMERLAQAGHLRAGSRRAIVDSAMVIAAPSSGPQPDVGSAEALRAALLAARGIGYSTGPSGTALLRLLDSWGLKEQLGERLRQAPPGVPVGKMVGQGDVDIGFQQLSELQGLPGVNILGAMPPGLEIITRFVGAVAATSTQPEAAERLLQALSDPAFDAIKQSHGMAPPAGT